MLTLANFTYPVPPELIAQTPAVPRDSSRLLVLDRETQAITHHHFSDLPDLLQPTDVIVRNNTKVIPARIYGKKLDTGGDIEFLLIKRLGKSEKGEIWECLSKPGLKLGQRVGFADSNLELTCIKMLGYSREIEFNQAGSELFSSLDQIGHTPLPPYIDWTKHDEQELRHLYQTTYAKFEGSAAAPTAGLHFTPELDQRLIDKGVAIEEVTLHVGLGTFLRVKVDDIAQHHMHSETYSLTPEVAERLNHAKQAGRRIIVVGTTTTRVLETCADATTGLLQPNSGDTDIFIYPPKKFAFVNNLITNFHESQSTLLMLVSALTTAPNTSHEFTTFADSPVGKAYQTAIDEKYRLHSFGDAMWIRG
ncbi:MAG TPA: tRNA preQ1(34) S-adenosylmethionine ribosyltransferase-isomerase QueA [Vitreimonas sp.]|nr:tRNA preQ1(34) S-adenosylmethionine ribosyltransferase-isomerase QueA [Vitreimonas sp.]